MSTHVRDFDSINKLVDLITDADGVVTLSIDLSDKDNNVFTIPLSEINEVYSWLSAVDPKPHITPIEFWRSVSKAFLGTLPFIPGQANMSGLVVTVKEGELRFVATIDGVDRHFTKPTPRRGELIYTAHMLGRLHDSLKLLVWSWDNEYTVTFDGTTYHVTDLTALATNAAAEAQAEEQSNAAS